MENEARRMNLPEYQRANLELEAARITAAATVSSDAIKAFRMRQERAEDIQWMQVAGGDAAPHTTPRRHRQGAGSRQRSWSRH